MGGLNHSNFFVKMGYRKKGFCVTIFLLVLKFLNIISKNHNWIRFQKLKQNFVALFNSYIDIFKKNSIFVEIMHVKLIFVTAKPTICYF